VEIELAGGWHRGFRVEVRRQDDAAGGPRPDPGRAGPARPPADRAAVTSTVPRIRCPWNAQSYRTSPPPARGFYEPVVLVQETRGAAATL